MNEYLPLRDYAMIGNCRTAALISRNGSIDWCCLPRFDSPAFFCRLLDAERGSFLQVGPTENAEIDRGYLADTHVLQTRYRTDSGELAVTDFLPVPHGEPSESTNFDGAKIFRLLEVREGNVEIQVKFRYGFDFGRKHPPVRLEPRGLQATTGDESFHLKLPGEIQKVKDADHLYEGQFRMNAKERRWITLCYGAGATPLDVTEEEADKRLEQTCSFWRAWIGRGRYRGKYARLMKRSAIVLKSLVYHPTGALIAAPTTSLPERMGGDLNWDYRFSWLRDSGLVLDVLQQLGYHDESIRFFKWIERLCGSQKGHLQPVYRIDGSCDLCEKEVDHLNGYRGSRPVRIGNAAATQFQLDVPGHILDAAFLCFTRMPRKMEPELWKVLCDLVDLTVQHWREPDAGIWEDRGDRKQYLHSKLYCWVALDRALRLATQFSLPADLPRWRSVRREIEKVILTEGYDPATGAFRMALDAEGSDATGLVIALAGLLPAHDPRIRMTLEHLWKELSQNGLIYRRRRSGHAPDEGAFLLCNFWLVDVLLASGRRVEAETLFERIVGMQNEAGILPEEVDPLTGDWLGNFPQGFTHLALIRSAIRLSEA